MNRDDLVRELRELVLDVVPNADAATLDPALPLREQVEMDSMDALTLAERIAEELGVEIPEKDYRRLASLDALADWLQSRVP